MGFLHWFQAGFAWFGGMLAGIAMLMWMGRTARFRSPLEGALGESVGALRMLDLAAPAAAIGYGVGQDRLPALGRWRLRDQDDAALGCPHAAGCPGSDAGPGAADAGLRAAVLARAGMVVVEASQEQASGQCDHGRVPGVERIGRFLVEFVRINPKLYWGMSNAQVAALGRSWREQCSLRWRGRGMCSGLPRWPKIRRASGLRLDLVAAQRRNTGILPLRYARGSE